MQLSFFFFPKYLLEWGVVGHSEQFNVQEKKEKKWEFYNGSICKFVGVGGL